MFWTTAFLFKHLGTTGIELWDREIADIRAVHQTAENNNNNLRPFSAKPIISLVPTPPSSSYDYVHDEDVASVSSSSGRSFESGKRYTGCVVDWRGSYGFLVRYTENCTR